MSDDFEKPEPHPKVAVQDLTTTLQILVARSIQTHEQLARPVETQNVALVLHEVMKNQIALMGACAALLTNVINVKESLGEA